MQFTYEEAVRKLSDFLEKHATSDNYCEMEQVLLTVLEGDDKHYQSIYEEGQDDGYTKGYNRGLRDVNEGAYREGYEAGLAEAQNNE